MGCACSSEGCSSESWPTSPVPRRSPFIVPHPSPCFGAPPALVHQESIILGKGVTSAHLGFAMLQANNAAALISTGTPYNVELAQDMAQKIIRKAKNEGCTVSVVNSSLYIDYKYVGQLPAEMR